jgi:hypothetical protein
MTNAVEAAQAAYELGLCVVPPRQDGTKAPTVINGKWEQWQDIRPTREQMNGWYGGDEPRSGLGLVLGSVCDNVEMFEFEGDAIVEGMYDEFLERVKSAGLDDVWLKIANGYTEETPGGGIHVLLRTDEPADSMKLATRPMTRPEFEASIKDSDRIHFEKHPDQKEKRFLQSVKTMSETKGVGGYSIVAPSNGQVHPNGKAWVLTAGGFDAIATVTVDERDRLYDIVRSLDVKREHQKKAVEVAPPRASDGEGPADRYNTDSQAKENILALLVKHGWELESDNGGVLHLTRPGKDTKEGISATLGYHADPPMFQVFSTSTEFDIDRGYTPFQVYSILEYGGNQRTHHSEAAFELIREGYGDDARSGQSHTPPELDADQLPSHLRLYRPGDLGGFIPPISDSIIEGPIGEWLTLIEPETEASLEALGAGALSGLGASLGRQMGLDVGRLRHRTNLFSAVVGPSGRARKGTADGEVRKLLSRVDPGFAAMNIASGFGSGEAIVSRLQDPVYHKEKEHEIVRGTLDPRLLVNEGELAQVFRIMARQGSILADVLRDAFDGRTLENHTNTRGDIRATNAHVSLAGGITPDELVSVISSLSGTNGVGARFLWQWSNPKKYLPEGGRPVDIGPVVDRMQWDGLTLTYTMTEAARSWWHDKYAELKDTPHLHESIHAITNRTTDHVQRIALIYAAIEGTKGNVDVRHLEAGEAWTDHSHAVVQSVLGGLVRDGLAGRVLSDLRSHPGQPIMVSEIHDLLNRNSTGAAINAAIEALTQAGLAWRFHGEGSSKGGPKPHLVVATTPLDKETP